MTTTRSSIAWGVCGLLMAALVTNKFSEREVGKADEKADSKIVLREDVVYGRAE